LCEGGGSGLIQLFRINFPGAFVLLPGLFKLAGRDTQLPGLLNGLLPADVTGLNLPRQVAKDVNILCEPGKGEKGYKKDNQYLFDIHR
jgi:hypothetical protein